MNIKTFRIRIALFTLLFALTIFAPHTFAANIYIEKKTHINFDGQIEKGDAERVAFLIEGMPRVDVFMVNSAGGSISEALKIASLLKGIHAYLVVKPGKICASACFFMFIAATTRSASPFYGKDGENPSPQELPKKSLGRVGIHRPYLVLPKGTSEKSFEKQDLLMRDIRAYLIEEQVPQNLIDEMMGRGSNEVYWLREKDLDLIGEYSPGYEEMLIQKCGYEKLGIYSKWNKSKADEFVACEADVWHREFSRSQFLFSVRLLEGWRPWIKK